MCFPTQSLLATAGRQPKSHKTPVECGASRLAIGGLRKIQLQTSSNHSLQTLPHLVFSDRRLVTWVCRCPRIPKLYCKPNDCADTSVASSTRHREIPWHFAHRSTPVSPKFFPKGLWDSVLKHHHSPFFSSPLPLPSTLTTTPLTSRAASSPGQNRPNDSVDNSIASYPKSFNSWKRCTT